MVNGPFIRVIILAGLFRHSSTTSGDINPQENDALVDDSDGDGVTCYTCVNVSDNSMCNEFAIDRPCPKAGASCRPDVYSRLQPQHILTHSHHLQPQRTPGVSFAADVVVGTFQFFVDGENFCHTLHIMDSTGASVVVNKKCADSRECLPQSVGCVSIDSQTVCVSCCDEMYCNVTVPTNKTTAVYSSTRKTPKNRLYPVISKTRARNISPSLITPSLPYSLFLLSHLFANLS